ncbi:MAG TPA: M20 family metallo-hydrolase [Thermoplasmata archaeon]|nr:M20 family metallo-hydrolase [Thermoplasmata archaeon]
MKEKGFQIIDSRKEEIVNILCSLVSIPAVSPINGGKGEKEKVNFLRKLAEEAGFDQVKEYVKIDDTGTERPSLVVVKKGKNSSLPKMWVVTHVDVVPAGDLKKWQTEPFEPVVKDGRIYGRGTEDNGQELVASFYALKVLSELDITPERDIGLVMAADEENGSVYGMKYLLNEEKIFSKEDLVVVPDHGNREGTLLEVAEKSILWLRILTEGRQSHASEPERGINAFKAANHYCVEMLQALKESFPEKNELFKPPESTFEPTKKEANVPNINTIPGEDVFYFDCRVLPRYSLHHVLSLFRKKASEIEKRFGVKIRVDEVQREEAAPPTSPDAPVIKILKKAVKNVYGVEPQPGGIGGGTCGAIFRKAGIQAVVWAKIDDMAHAPNEYCRIENLIGDTKVYLDLYTQV